MVNAEHRRKGNRPAEPDGGYGSVIKMHRKSADNLLIMTYFTIFVLLNQEKFCYNRKSKNSHFDDSLQLSEIIKVTEPRRKWF